MALDLIKQYLIGIGFKVDNTSVKDAESSLSGTEEKIKKFNNESNKSFLDTNKTITDLFSILKSTSLGVLFPDLQKPFNSLIKDIKLAEKTYKGLVNSSKEKVNVQDNKLSEKHNTKDKNKTDSIQKNPTKNKKPNIEVNYKINSDSVKDVENSLSGTGEKIKKFNDESNKSFSNASKEMKDFFALLKFYNQNEVFPDLQKPLNDLIEDIKLAEKAYKDLESSSKEKVNVQDNKLSEKHNTKDKNKIRNIKNNSIQDKNPINRHNKIKNRDQVSNRRQIDNKNINKLKEGDNKSFFNLFLKDIIIAKKNLFEFRKKSKDDLKSIENSTEKLSMNGGKHLLGFSLKGVSHFLLISGAIATVITMCSKLLTSLSDLGTEDIGYEKIARQLWTTKEYARDVDSALKTLGVSMQDLWLSPTLMKQFNQLMKDSQELRLPPEFKDNIEVVKNLNLEFKRAKQIVGLALKWIGSYILKYCAGPLLKIKNGLHKFNDGLLKAVPYIGKVIGSTIGIILRGILMIGQIVTPIFSILSKFIKFIINLIDKIPEPIKNIIKVIGLIAAAILTGPLGAIIGVIAVIDDLFTFLRGGESVIGNVFNKFKDKGLSAIEFIKKIGAVVFAGPIKAMQFLFKVFEGGKSLIDSVFGFFEEKGENVANIIEKVGSVLMSPLKLVQDLFKLIKGGKSLIGNAFGFLKDKDKRVNIAEKVEYFNKNSKDGNAPKSYVTNRSTSNQTNTSNSNNKIDNNNVINVYGSGDPKATANEVDRNLTGIHQRNLGGVF